MSQLDEIRKTIRDYITSSGNPYSAEKNRDKLLKALRKGTSIIINALDGALLDKDEVTALSEVAPDYVSLSGDRDYISSLSRWVERNGKRENTDEIRLYIAEAERICSSLFI